MSELFWSEKFEWLEQEPMTDEQIEALAIEERIQRELKLAKILSAYKGRWVIIKNQDVVASGGTLAEVLDGRDKKVEAADAVIQIPEKNYKNFYFEQAA